MRVCVVVVLVVKRLRSYVSDENKSGERDVPDRSKCNSVFTQEVIFTIKSPLMTEKKRV